MNESDTHSPSFERIRLSSLTVDDRLMMTMQSEIGAIYLQFRVDNTDTPTAPLGRLALRHHDINSDDNTYSFRIIGCYKEPTGNEGIDEIIGYKSLVYRPEELIVGSYLNGIVSISGAEETGMSWHAREQRKGLIAELVVVRFG